MRPLSLIGLLACAEEVTAPPLVCDPADPPTVLAGDPDTAFVPYADGEGPDVERGPQGGQHVRISLEAAPASPDTGPWTIDLTALVRTSCDGAPCDWTAGRLSAEVPPDHPAVVPVERGVRFEDLLILVDWWPSDHPRSLTGTWTDACGNTAPVSLTLDPS